MNITDKLKEGLWGEAIPLDFNLNKLVKEGVYTGPYPDMSTIISDTRDVLFSIYAGGGNRDERQKILSQREPVSLKKVIQFLNRFEDLVQDNLDNLTFPKSTSGYNAMLNNVIDSGKLENLVLMYTIDPQKVIEAFENKIEKIENRNSKWLQSIINFKIEQEMEVAAKNKEEMDKVEELLNFGNTENNDEKKIKEKEEKKLTFFQRPKEISEEIEKLTKDLETVFEKIRSDEESVNKDRSLYSRELGVKIRESYLRHADKSSLNDWFLDVLIESQYNLLYKKDYEGNNSYYASFYLELMNDYSNDLCRIGFDPESVLNDKKLWGALKVVRDNINNHDYKLFTNSLLPKFLTLKSWDKTEKIAIGENILSKVIKDDLNFKTRLNLWLDIGGSLTITNKEGNSIVDILQKNNNKMWNDTIIETAKDKGVNLHKNYPDNFKDETSYSFSKKDINQVANRLSPF